MKVALVTGTRSVKYRGVRPAVYGALDGFVPDLVLHGGASGVDAIADAWAKWYPSRERPATVWRFVAPWDHAGRFAGPHRNAAMVAAAAALRDEGHEVRVLAFPAQDSRGTWDCVRRAKKAGLDVDVRKEGEAW